jgi:hypothetical protein
MSETKFKVGDWVLVIDSDRAMHGKTGQVQRYETDMPRPYLVLSTCGSCDGWYRGDELEPDPAVNERLIVDNVNHPPHYNQGSIECIDAIKAATGSGFVKYCTGNVIKYLWRYDNKGGLEDLKKAAWYLDRLIKEMGNE